MTALPERAGTYPVGIDLGTTYSSLAYLTPQGQPVTMPNAEGELSTPSIVFFDGDDVIVGTEALRHSVSMPDRVVQHAKRFMGDPHKCWVIDGRVYRPRDISAYILKKLLLDAREQLGSIRHAVITVPAQFSDLQRRDTVEAGLAAGLERVDLIHEPVAAALCYVLGEGMWFAELASEQTVLVFDLGGGTFDLSLVKYHQQEVRVLASGGDLSLGGLDWNRILESHFCDQFMKTSISDPRLDRESMQALMIEVEQVKRSLSVRPRSTLLIQHDGRRKSYVVERDDFEALAGELVLKTEQITRDLLKANQIGWARIDAILATGGSSRMPMIRNMLQRLGGTTLNQTLSPDQSISHGAAYYAGMLHSGQRLEKSVLTRHATGRLANFRQQSVSGRSLGILIRDMKLADRRPHYLLPANTPLPCAYRQQFGTVIPNQKKVHLHIIESGASPTDPWVELGECIIDGLPDPLPVSSPIEVTIRYDEQARVHVEAVVISSGQRAQAHLIRPPLVLPAGEGMEPGQVNHQQQSADSPQPDQFALLSPHQEESITRPPQKKPLPEAKPVLTSPVATRRSAASSQKARTPMEKTSAASPEDIPLENADLSSPSPLSSLPSAPVRTARPVSVLEESERPIPLCNRCGEVLTPKGRCPNCERSQEPGSAAAPRRSVRKRPVKTGEDILPTEQIPAVSPPPLPSGS